MFRSPPFSLHLQRFTLTLTRLTHIASSLAVTRSKLTHATRLRVHSAFAFGGLSVVGWKREEAAAEHLSPPIVLLQIIKKEHFKDNIIVTVVYSHRSLRFSTPLGTYTSQCTSRYQADRKVHTEVCKSAPRVCSSQFRFLAAITKGTGRNQSGIDAFSHTHTDRLHRCWQEEASEPIPIFH